MAAIFKTGAGPPAPAPLGMKIGRVGRRPARAVMAAISRQPPGRPAGTPRDENSGARSETGPSVSSYFLAADRAGLPAPLGMKTALRRSPARAVSAIFRQTGARRPPGTPRDENSGLGRRPARAVSAIFKTVALN